MNIRLPQMLAATLALFATLVVTAPGSAAAADACMSPVEVQAAIAAKQIKSWPTIKAMAGISSQYKEVGPVRVCEQGGVRYYVVAVTGPSGESKQLVLNAVDASN